MEMFAPEFTSIIKYKMLHDKPWVSAKRVFQTDPLNQGAILFDLYIITYHSCSSKKYSMALEMPRSLGLIARECMNSGGRSYF